MARKLISSGSSFEKVAGYSRAVVDGSWVFVSGTTGFDYAAGTISDEVVEQTRQALRNIDAALRQADSSLADVVRIRVFITKAEDFAVIAPVLGEFLGDVRPANTTVVCQLVDAKMKVEIEVTALRQ
ncbi:MAG TPA: RidA family protein [Azospirillaceae bacterium]|nr:RidA family protein [Azospirillaceae bacterium]HRQ82721.1 RidA family protein [Azospirillaceae bacterium]